VNGKVVVRDGELTTIDEGAVIDEIRGYMPEFQKEFAQAEAINRRFAPYYAEIYRRCQHEEVALEPSRRITNPLTPN
jgi:5-methylthioadenosine/S-adenosylhomocysteine deaminase